MIRTALLATTLTAANGFHVAPGVASNRRQVAQPQAQMGLVSAVAGLFGGKKQDFLEADPYWDQSDIPVNTFKNKAPHTGKVISCKRIVGPEATGETCHIIDHEGKMPYWEASLTG